MCQNHFDPAPRARSLARISEISLAAPAFNEAENIEATVTGWLDYLRSRPWLSRFEIVVCNDGSKDQTGLILEGLAARYPEVCSTHFVVNQGAAAALNRAISKTSLEWVLLIDSDGQFPIENLERMIEVATAMSVLAVAGVRPIKADSAFARFGSWSSGFACNMFHGSECRDFNCAFKLVNGALLRSLCLEAKGLNYSTEVTSKLLERRVRLAEVEIEHRPRIRGKSSLKLIKGALHRLLFVLYIGIRQLLFRFQVLQREDR